MTANPPPKKILAVKLRALGDTVLMTAALKTLRQTFPFAEIHAVVTDQWAPLLQNQSYVDRIWPFTKRKTPQSKAKAIISLGLKLRKEQYDWVINFHASSSSAWLSFSSGAKTRAIHFHGHQDKNRFSTVIIPGKGRVKPAIERDLDCLRALGVICPKKTYPEITLSSSQREFTKKKLGLLDPPNQKLCVIGLGASRPTKCWPVERFAEVARAWKETGFNDNNSSTTSSQRRVGVITGPNEAPLQEKFRDLFKEDFISIHAPKLDQLCAMISVASFFIGNDSGPKHLAVALGVPTLTFFGPEDPYEWHPYPEDTHPTLYVPNLECRSDQLPGHPPWCGLQVCKEKKHQCMLSIEVNDAIAKMKSTWKIFDD